MLGLLDGTFESVLFLTFISKSRVVTGTWNSQREYISIYLSVCPSVHCPSSILFCSVMATQTNDVSCTALSLDLFQRAFIITAFSIDGMFFYELMNSVLPPSGYISTRPYHCNYQASAKHIWEYLCASPDLCVHATLIEHKWPLRRLKQALTTKKRAWRRSKKKQATVPLLWSQLIWPRIILTGQPRANLPFPLGLGCQSINQTEREEINKTENSKKWKRGA